PVLFMNFLAGSMLRCSGNTLIPGLLKVVMCGLDVLFNWLLIFPDRTVSVLGHAIDIPGAGLGVRGAAIGTVLAEFVVVCLMMWYLLGKSRHLSLKRGYINFRLRREVIRKALRISLPMGTEHIIMCSAQIFITLIVAPLGTAAIAANAFAITAESLCYTPGFGIADAATTLVGQTIGAGRRRLTRRFAHISLGMGVGVMSIMGCLMYVGAQLLMEIFTPVEHVRSLGVEALRIEAFAEPMYAASIVVYGIFVGAGDTLVPSIMNLVSIWGVRIPLAAWLATTMGLKGVWIAMCIELCFRGLIFLVRLARGRWIEKATKLTQEDIIQFEQPVNKFEL
ncbi:MAG: MATE family efflux transporter, partial [Muribaculaceae bacterium]|nr:MATE family efflux transporter [Muribaculaceae bacterium]